MNHPSQHEHPLACLEHRKKKAETTKARIEVWTAFFTMITAAATAVAVLTPGVIDNALSLLRSAASLLGHPL